MVATVTLPGGNGSFTAIPVGQDAKTALTAAIKNLFNAAGSNITANELPSGVNGMQGFFNLVLDGQLAATTIAAGTNVQAIFDTGLGQDTLVGNSATTLFVANSAGDSISSSAAASTIVGGAGSDTVSATGAVSAYLEGGSNLVNLAGGALSLLGTGGNDTVNIVSGSNTVTAAYKATVDLTGNGTKDQITLADGSTVSVTGGGVVATVTGNNETIYINGSNESINLVGSGDTVIFIGGSNDTITYTNPGKAHSHSATVIGGGDDHGHGHGHDKGYGNAKGNGPGHGETIVAGAGSASTIHGGHADLTRAGGRAVFVGRHADTLVGATHDTTAGSGLFRLDTATRGSQTTAAFSNQHDTVAINHLVGKQHKIGFEHATIAGGGATFFTSNNTKITLLGDTVSPTTFKLPH
jgi:hypothetical protein